MTEVVDVVDAEDRVIGCLPRAALRSSGSNYRVVHVLVLDRRGRLLLQVPAAARERAFRLGSSVAGHVHAGESYAMAARREFMEELGVNAPELRELGTTWIDDDGRRKFVGVFVARTEGPFRPDPGEVEALEWLELRAVRARVSAEPTAFSETFRRVLRHADAAGALDFT